MSTNQTVEPATGEAPADEHHLIELDVTGMTCGSCVARVQSALG
jgi:hypothetical protein